MSKKFFLLTLLFLSVLTGFSQNAQYYLDQGVQAYRAGEYDRALRLFDQAIRLDNASSEAFLYRGNTNFILARYADAERDYTASLENNFRARPESTGGTFRMNGITIMEPDPYARDNDVYALLYNNRGASRYLQGKRDEAMRDFDQALDFNPGLQYARENIETTTGRSSGGSGSTYSSTSNPSFSSTRGPMDRPIEPVKWDNVDDLTEQAEDVRDYREDGRLSGLAGLFQPRPFQKRNVPRRGKVYKEPNVAGMSQDYIRIVEVEINDRETLVTIGVTNNERRSFYARIFAPGTPEAYVLSDRNPDPRKGVRYELLDVDNEEITRNTGIQIRPGEEFTFVLTFQKLDDDIGYVNLVEGGLQVDNAWNFYHIDLTR